MHCIGDTHDLKRSHSLGYFLMIKVHPDIISFRDVIRLEKRILAEFNPKYCRLLEEYRVWFNLFYLNFHLIVIGQLTEWFVIINLSISELTALPNPRSFFTFVNFICKNGKHQESKFGDWRIHSDYGHPARYPRRFIPSWRFFFQSKKFHLGFLSKSIRKNRDRLSWLETFPGFLAYFLESVTWWCGWWKRMN